MPDWDIAIIGGGAAGLSAAATAAAAGRRTLLLDRMGGGGELMNLGAIPGHDSGPDLAAALLEQATSAGAELAITEVTGLRRDGSAWVVDTDDGPHRAAAVVLAVGLGPGTLGLPEEAAFEGQGLSHCAACDGPMYGGQPVVVVGADRWAVHEARELVEMGCEVTLVTQGEGTPADPPCTVIAGHVTALVGNSGLERVRLDTGAELAAQVVFVQTGRRPALGFVPAGLAVDADGRVVTGPDLRSNLPNLLAIGDARAGSPRTLEAAIADGQRAGSWQAA